MANVLYPDAHAANIVGSLQVYVDAKLASTFPGAIDYGGGRPFSDEALAEWLQVRVVGVARPQALMGLRDVNEVWGQEGFWVLNINCFVRPQKQSSLNNLRLWTIRDLVLTQFLVGTRIVVRDYASGGGTVVGNLFVDEITADRPIPDPRRVEIEQHNLVWALRWSESWLVS